MPWAGGRMPFPGGLWWLLCCRQGFTLLRRDYGEPIKGPDCEAEEEEESFELRNKGDQGSLEVNLTQPGHTGSSSERSLPIAEEMRSLITEKGSRRADEDPDAIVKGWLQREVRGGVKTPWLRPRKYWFVLTQDSLDYYSGNEAGARRLGSLVLTSLCSVLWPDKQTYKETGYWAVTVFGRKHCYRLYTEHLNEAVHWVCALQKVIDSKVPVQTPTQLLMRDIEENQNSPTTLEQIYHSNPILRYTSGPIYAPLLPFPYGGTEHPAPGARGYAAPRDEAVKLFHSLQQLEGAREPAPLMQGVLQTCQDLPQLVDEVYCQLVKQTTEPPTPGGPSDLRYWQLLTCMSCTFLPSVPVLRYLHHHLQRTESQFPKSEMAQYGHFIAGALGKTKGRECVPSLEEIAGLMGRRELLCTVYCPGSTTCCVGITSHTTAQEVAQELVSHLGLAQSPNTFALYAQQRQSERPIPGDALVADVLTRFENLAGEESARELPGRLCFKHYGCLTTDSVPHDNLEFTLLFEQAHELVLRGYMPASEETLQSLAALRLQSLNGDFSAHAPFPRLDELFPASVLNSRLCPLPPAMSKAFPAAARGLLVGALPTGLWGGPTLAKQQAEREQRLRGRLREEGVCMMGAIVDKWKQLRGMGKSEAMEAYMALVREWPGFGSALFEVDISSSGSSQRLWLGIGAVAVSLYRPGEAEPFDTFGYSGIEASTATNGATLCLSLPDRELLLHTPRADEITQLLHIYVASMDQEQEPPGTPAPSFQQGLCPPAGPPEMDSFPA
uniref:Pleckstrin homology, MyTH4 and FERM domain containing H3 n=1 Tax=Sphenodon punctatus TaxID=8508 RepID=A0A8D0L445_SPHPU